MRFPCLPGGSWSVSIHAPAQGATGGEVFISDQAVFQSTPPHRGRPWVWLDLVAWIIPKNVLSLVFSTLGVV